MRFFYAVCRKFAFKDDFSKARLGHLVGENKIYRAFVDDNDDHYIFVDNKGVDDIVYLGKGLSQSTKGANLYKFDELTLKNFYKHKGCPRIADSIDKMSGWLLRTQNPFVKYMEDATPEDIELGDEYISDVDFILESYETLHKTSDKLEDGFLSSLNDLIISKDLVDPPTTEQEAINKLFEKVEEFNQTRDPSSLSLAQLMIYYIFGFKQNI